MQSPNDNFMRRILLRFGMQEPTDEFPDYYQMLDVVPSAPEDQISVAIEVRSGLLEALDPLDPLRQRLTGRLREAARVLLNKADRAIYDRGLARNLATAQDMHHRFQDPAPAAAALAPTSVPLPNKASQERPAKREAARGPLLFILAGAACAVLVLIAGITFLLFVLFKSPEKTPTHSPIVALPTPRPLAEPSTRRTAPIVPVPDTSRATEPARRDTAPIDKGTRFTCTIPPADTKKWRIVNGMLEQTSTHGEARILFGERAWSGYDFSIEFQKINGNDQIGLLFLHDDGKKWGCDFGLGSLKNTAHTIERWGPGKPRQVMLQGKGGLGANVWYSAQVRVRGRQVECYLDGQKMFWLTVDTHGTGQVGLRTVATSARFRNIKVTDPMTGQVLLDGLPVLPAP